MKVLCSACEAAEARLLCCADEAALCARCDRDVHAANRLAGKHHRLPLLPTAGASSAPTCDICQESHAYFFCVEDRALLCRACDVAVHTANAFVSAHRRFLLTGVQVGLQPDCTTAAAVHDADPHPPEAAAAPLQTPPPPAAGSPAPLYSDDDIDWAAGAGAGAILPDWSLVHDQFAAPAPPVPRPAADVPALARTPNSKRSPRRSPLAAAAFTVQAGGGVGGLAGGLPDWPLDDFFGFSAEYTAGLGFAENGTSKADSGKLGGSTDSSPAGRSSSDASQDFFGEVPEFHQWSVPELPSPPTASGLHWQGGTRHGGTTGTNTDDAAAVFVPDISSPVNPFRCYAATAAGLPPAKRRRRC